MNASHADFASGVNGLIKAEAFYPGWLAKLLTTPVHGLDSKADVIKVFMEVSKDPHADG